MAAQAWGIWVDEQDHSAYAAHDYGQYQAGARREIVKPFPLAPNCRQITASRQSADSYMILEATLSVTGH